MATQKELNEQLLNTLKKWQVVEDQSVKSTTEIMEQTILLLNILWK